MHTEPKAPPAPKRVLWTRSSGLHRTQWFQILLEVSRENVDRVRLVFDAFAEAGDIEAVVPFHTEDLVIHAMPEWPDDPEYHGHDGLRKLVHQWTENFDEFGFEVLDVRDGGDAVVALLEMTGRTKGAGVPVGTRLGGVFSEFRDGLIGRVRYFSNWPDALDAAGLSE